jgi:hypothetical protein
MSFVTTEDGTIKKKYIQPDWDRDDVSKGDALWGRLVVDKRLLALEAYAARANKYKLLSQG